MTVLAKSRAQNAFIGLEQGTNPHALAYDMLLKSLNESTFEKSLQNCHHAGLSSVVLHDDTASNGGMIRFFYAIPGKHGLDHLFNNEGHFTLGVHNHRYQIALVPLIGSFTNMRVELCNNGPTLLHEYAFASALADDDVEAVRTVHLREVRAHHIDPHVLSPGDYEQMDSTDLHTVFIPTQDKPVAWMVIEGPSVGTESRIYSPRADLTVTTKDLYQPLSPDLAEFLTAYVLDNMVRG